jgi:hypothetical protein
MGIDRPKVVLGHGGCSQFATHQSQIAVRKLSVTARSPFDLQAEVAFSKMRSARAMMGITGCFTEIFVSGFFRDAV